MYGTFDDAHTGSFCRLLRSGLHYDCAWLVVDAQAEEQTQTSKSTRKRGQPDGGKPKVAVPISKKAEGSAQKKVAAVRVKKFEKEAEKEGCSIEAGGGNECANVGQKEGGRSCIRPVSA